MGRGCEQRGVDGDAESPGQVCGVDNYGRRICEVDSEQEGREVIAGARKSTRSSWAALRICP